VENECLWQWWSKGDPELGPVRRRVADDGRTIRQDETWDAMVQAMCEGAGVERRSLKQMN
jgi:hypothetical protein